MSLQPNVVDLRYVKLCILLDVLSVVRRKLERKCSLCSKYTEYRKNILTEPSTRKCSLCSKYTEYRKNILTEHSTRNAGLNIEGLIHFFQYWSGE